MRQQLQGQQADIQIKIAKKETKKTNVIKMVEVSKSDQYRLNIYFK